MINGVINSLKSYKQGQEAETVNDQVANSDVYTRGHKCQLRRESSDVKESSCRYSAQPRGILLRPHFASLTTSIGFLGNPHRGSQSDYINHGDISRVAYRRLSARTGGKRAQVDLSRVMVPNRKIHLPVEESPPLQSF